MMTSDDVVKLAQCVRRLRAEGQNEQAKAKLANLSPQEHDRVTRCIGDLERSSPEATVTKDLHG